LAGSSGQRLHIRLKFESAAISATRRKPLHRTPAATTGAAKGFFDICDQVTVLNLGRTLAAGTPAQIRVHKEVVNAYLGG